MTALSIGPALFFFGMGAVALVRPERILALFGTPRLTLDGRNEVRAVYGGFGIAICVLLLWSASRPIGVGVDIEIASSHRGDERWWENAAVRCDTLTANPAGRPEL